MLLTVKQAGGGDYTTIAAALASIGTAAGDGADVIVEVYNGIYTEGILNTLPSGTSWDHPFTLRVAAGNTATIRNTGERNIFVYEPTSLAFFSIIAGFILDGQNLSSDQVAFSAAESAPSSIWLRDCEFINTENENAVLTGAFATDIRLTGLHIHGGDFFTTANAAGHNHGIYHQGSDSIIEDCIIHDVPGFGIHLYSSDSPLPDDNIVEHNTVYDYAKLSTTGAGILVTSGARNICRQNIVYDGLALDEDGAVGIAFGGDDTECYNNTTYNNSWIGIEAASSTNAKIKNNIAFGNGQELEFTGATGLDDSNNFTSDPDFVHPSSGDFHLQAGSDAIDYGVDVGLPFSGAAPDAGAFEFGTESAPDPGQGTGAFAGVATMLASGALVANQGSGALAGVGTMQAVGELIAVEGSGAFAGVATMQGYGQLLFPDQHSVNPKTFLLRVTDARIGANGVLEWDLVREDLSVYGNVVGNPMLGSNVLGGAPAPPLSIAPSASASGAVPGSTKLVLLDLPLLLSSHDQAGLYAAASGINPNWTGALVYEKIGSEWVEVAQLTRATIGGAETKLLAGAVTLFDGSGRTFQFDDVNTLDVALYDTVSALESVADDDILAGQNIAAIGQNGRWEIVGYGSAVQLGARRFRLSHLLRGLKGTEWAIGLHQIGDQFVLLDESLRRISDSTSDLNVPRQFRGVSVGTALDSAAVINFTNTGVSLKPLAPVYIRGEEDDDQNRILRCYVRSRLDGLAGRDGTAAPPLDEPALALEWDIYNAAGTTVLRTLTSNSESAVYLKSEMIDDFGSVPSSLRVSVYEVSTTVGRGYVGSAVLSDFDEFVGSLPELRRDNEVLFNYGGVITSEPEFNYNKTTNILSVDVLSLGIGANVAVNRQTLSGTLTLTTSSKRYQNLDPNGSNRNVDLPAEAEGLAFFIVNSGNGGEVITIRNDAAGTVDTINNNQGLSVISDSTVWISAKATLVIV